MSYSDGYSKSVSEHDRAESRASTICAFIPIVNIGVAIGKMLGGSVTNGFHERKRFMKEWARDEDHLFYQFLQNSYDGETKFTTEKTAYIPCCPESGDDPNLMTSSRTEVYRKAVYDIFCKDRSIETLEKIHEFNNGPSTTYSLDYLNFDFNRNELPSLVDVKRELPDLYVPPKVKTTEQVLAELGIGITPKFDSGLVFDVTKKRDSYLDNFVNSDWEDDE